MAASGRNVTSFQKKTRGKTIQIAGAKPSLHNNQLLISTGVPSLDGVIGGGLAVGTVLLVEEDTYGSYSHTILKYFLAEGVMHRHHVFVASASTPTEEILQELPGPIVDDPGPLEPAEEAGDMKIAWRYQNMPQVQSTMSTGASKFSHYYDMSKTMDEEMVKKTPLTQLNVDSLEQEEQSAGRGSMRSSYLRVLQQIQATVQAGHFSTDLQGVKERNILRIGLQGVGGPLWGEEGEGASLCRFLYALRSILRRAYASALITIPTHLFSDPAFIKRVEHLCDTVIQLDSFAGSDKETNPAFKEYHGLLNLVKLPRLNSLTCHMPDSTDLAFKLRRKKFMIEKLHLPPELSETANRNQEDPLKPLNQAACSTGTGSNKLDF